MANWDALGLGGTGRVDVRGSTPPIGNTGPGGAEGMGLMALLRRLSMGMDDRGPEELPQPMSPDPMAERGMAQMLGMIPGPTPDDLAAMGQPMQPMMETRGGITPTMRDLQAMGPMQPFDPGMMGGGSMAMPPDMGAGMPGMMPPSPVGTGMGTNLTPEEQRAIFQEEMRRLGASSGY